MNEAVPRNEAAVINVLPAADRNHWSGTTKRIKISAAFGTKTKEVAPLAKLTPPKEANRAIPRIGWVSSILAPTPQTNANIVCGKITRPKVVKPASNMGRGTFSAWLPQSFPTFKLKHPPHERGGCAVDPHRLTNDPAFLNSVIVIKSVFVKLEVCSSPVTAICDTGAIVSCNSQRFSKRLPLNFQNQLQLAGCRLLAANQAEISVSGTVILPISLASNRYQQQSFVLKPSETDCLPGLDFFENNRCDALFSCMQHRFPNSETVPLFHYRKALSDPSLEQVKVIARETAFIPSGLEAVVLGELLTQGFPEKSEGIFEPSSAFCEKYHLMAFSSLCQSREMIPARLINPDEDVTVNKGTSLRSFSVFGSAEIVKLNRVIADMPDHPLGQVPDKYDVKQGSTNSYIFGAAPSYIFRCVLEIRKENWQVRPCSAQYWPLPGLETGEVTQSLEAHAFQKSSSSKDWQNNGTQIDHAMPHSLKLTGYVGPKEKW